MKTKLFFLASLFLFSQACLLSQEPAAINLQTPTVKVNRMEICEMNLYLGLFMTKNAMASVADFQKLAPQSELLKGDFKDYTEYQYNGTYGSSMLSIMMGIRFSDPKKTKYRANPILRLGFTYFNTSNFSSSLVNETRKRCDTLVSSSNGTVYYVDSLITRNYNMNYNSDQLRLDASLIFRTDPTARWAFYSGFGITAGMSLNAVTHVSYSGYATTKSDYDPNGYYTYYPTGSMEDEFRYESNKAKNNFGFSANVPLGVDFRIGNKREFWKRTHLFYEFRPGVNVTAIPEINTTAQISLQHGIGIKVSWE